MMKWGLIFLLLVGPVYAYADPLELHKSILAALDSRNYPETVRLLNKMKQEQPQRYKDLPYALLHAHSLALANNFKEAFAMYESNLSDARLAPFLLLPLARIAAQQGIANTAVRYYQEYLKHAYPDYVSVAREALDYCWQLKKADLLYQTSQVIQKSSTLDRLAQLYLGRSYVLSGQRELARNLFLSLISYSKKDDVTNLALGELDLIEGTQISSQEKQRRGKLAYDVWNFDLAKKYLQPVALQNLDNGLYYGRTLFFLGEFENSRKAYEAALDAFPNDPKYSQVLYQYANVYFREGNYAKAADLYKRLKNLEKGELRDTATFKMIYAFRAQSRFQDAFAELEPYTRSKTLKLRGESLFLRGRIYFQMSRFKNAYDDFQQVLILKPFRNSKELTLWKALTLEKLNRPQEARNLYSSIASGSDFYSHKAREKGSLPVRDSAKTGLVDMPMLPDASRENEILSTYAAGEVIPALLYLHLYEEASQTLPDLDATTWKILGVNPNSRLQKFLTISFLGNLGGNYSTATYYSELFLKNIPNGIPLFSLPADVLKVIFPLPYREEVERFSRERQLDPFVVLSIMKQESKFKRFARSQTFARGLMQIIPSTATRLASLLNLQGFSVDQLYVPEVNINLGTRYVQDIVREFGNQVEVIAASYNGGEPNARRWRDCSTQNEILDFVSSIDFKETKNYVMIVKTNYEIYKRIYGGAFNVLTENSSKR